MIETIIGKIDGIILSMTITYCLLFALLILNIIVVGRVSYSLHKIRKLIEKRWYSE